MDRAVAGQGPRQVEVAERGASDGRDAERGASGAEPQGDERPGLPGAAGDQGSGLGRHGGGVQQTGHGKVDAQLLPDRRDEAHAEQGVPAGFEEVVLDTDGAVRQDPLPDVQQIQLRPAARSRLRGRPAPRRRERADHPQPVPPQAPGRGPSGGGSGGRRHHRARPARLRAALRQVHQGHGLRPRRPPYVQPARRGVRPGRDVLRHRLHDRDRGRRRVRRTGSRGRHPRRRPRCAEIQAATSSNTTQSAGSAPIRRAVSRNTSGSGFRARPPRRRRTAGCTPPAP
ncbi:hypothetical protein SALBM311S_01976 [Streptomyces alboniger]